MSDLTVYRGEGFCFHSLLRPADWTPVDTDLDSDNLLTVEARPKGAKEPRLKDAVATLQALPDTFSGFVRSELPERERGFDFAADEVIPADDEAWDVDTDDEP